MRASTRRRITIALIGLLVLVLIGWFVQGAVTDDAGSGSMPRGESSALRAVEQHQPTDTERPTDRR